MLKPCTDSSNNKNHTRFRGSKKKSPSSEISSHGSAHSQCHGNCYAAALAAMSRSPARDGMAHWRPDFLGCQLSQLSQLSQCYAGRSQHLEILKRRQPQNRRQLGVSSPAICTKPLETSESENAKMDDKLEGML